MSSDAGTDDAGVPGTKPGTRTAEAGPGPVVDLRSDTVTQPTDAMRAAMAGAVVGDDVYGEDPTVAELERVFAARMGKEAAIFVASGVMANQVALLTLTRPGDAVVCGVRQHVVAYENGAGPANAGVSFSTVPDDDGVLDPEDVAAALDGGRHHLPVPTLLAVENTHMASGGVPWTVEAMCAVGQVAADRGVPIHLDGARLWNASVALGATPAALAGWATTVMCCLSKGLAAPVGSVLAGPADLMVTARRHRHRLGGAMRQAGFLAAAGLVALDQMVPRLADDHRRAQVLAEAVADRWPSAGVDRRGVRTNVVVFPHDDPDALLAHLAAAGVAGGTVGPGAVRLVTHHGIDDDGVRRAVGALLSAP